MLRTHRRSGPGDVLAESLKHATPAAGAEVRTFNVIRNSVRHLIAEQLTQLSLRPRH